MKLAIGADHAGYELKGSLISYLKNAGYELTDCGCYSAESVDYPDIAQEVGKKVVSGEADYGILICGTGIGISIAANKISGVRCGVVYSEETAVLAKEHNDANIIALGARTNTAEAAKKMIDAFLNASFLGGRHALRVEKINRMDRCGVE